MGALSVIKFRSRYPASHAKIDQLPYIMFFGTGSGQILMSLSWHRNQKKIPTTQSGKSTALQLCPGFSAQLFHRLIIGWQLQWGLLALTHQHYLSWSYHKMLRSWCWIQVGTSQLYCKTLSSWYSAALQSIILFCLDLVAVSLKQSTSNAHGSFGGHFNKHIPMHGARHQILNFW